MAKRVALTAAHRVGSGKGEARSLRREGRVPAIAYGTDLDPTPVSVDSLELYHALRTDAGLNAVIRLDIEGDDHLAMARELQRHPIRRDVEHVDFVTINRNVKVTVDVPIVLSGEEEAPGTSEGGVLEQALYTLSIDVLPLDVPDQIDLDISDMNVGDVKRVEDLQVADGVDVLVEGEETIASIVVPQAEPDPDEEGGEEAGTADDVEATEEGGTDGGEE